MTDFDFDCKEKKRIAQGAYHKKNGSKSKGCHLPHEDLTAAEQKKLNGPVKTVGLDRPMKITEFRTLTADKQRLYLEYLRDNYHPTQDNLAEMFDVSTRTMFRLCKGLKITMGRKGQSPTKTQRAMWEAFCGGVVGGKPGEPKPEEAEEPKPEEPKTITIQREKVFEFKVDEVQPIDPMLIIQRQRDDISALKMELAFYKKLYYDLIDRMLGRRDDA